MIRPEKKWLCNAKLLVYIPQTPNQHAFATPLMGIDRVNVLYGFHYLHYDKKLELKKPITLAHLGNIYLRASGIKHSRSNNINQCTLRL